MSAVNFLTIVSGKRSQSVSTGLTPDFTGVRIGADTLPLVQGGSGGSAYFDFGSRSLRTSFVPAAGGDLINLTFLSGNYAPLVSPALSGSPTAPTQTSSDNSTKIATTAFVQTAVAAIPQIYSWQNAAIDYVSADPGSPSTGDRYVVAPTGTGAFAGQDNNIAQWNGSAWVFTTPTNGTIIDVLSYSAGIYFFNGSVWSQKNFASYTASKGVRIVANDIERDDAITFTNDNASPITVGQVVYVKSNGHVDLANATGSTVADAQIGLVEDASIASSSSGRVDVRNGFILTGLSSLTPGADYYLDNSTAGSFKLFGSITFATGDSVIRVGKALSASSLLFDPEFQYIY